VDFTVVYNRQDDAPKQTGVIRFGLAAVKGVGEKAVQQIIAAREKAGRFKSLFHFCENVDLRAVNKQVLEALIKAGAFDTLGGSRAQMMAGLEKAMQIGSSMQADLHKGQMNFFAAGAFGQTDTKADEQILPDVAPWAEQQMLTYEKEVLGFYVTSNPLSKHAEIIGLYSTANTSQLLRRQDKEVILGGMINKIRYNITRSGKNAGSKMAIAEFEDVQGKCEVVLFPKILEKYQTLLQVDRILFVRGKVDTRREIPNILCEELMDLEEVGRRFSGRVVLDVDTQMITESTLQQIRQICSRYRGKSRVDLNIVTPSRFRILARADASLSVRADLDCHKKLEALLGRGKVHFGA
jgi:DNA polymerase-3 subunit alpha